MYGSAPPIGGLVTNHSLIYVVYYQVVLLFHKSSVKSYVFSVIYLMHFKFSKMLKECRKAKLCLFVIFTMIRLVNEHFGEGIRLWLYIEID